jgi:hypothetical protein
MTHYFAEEKPGKMPDEQSSSLIHNAVSTVAMNQANMLITGHPGVMLAEMISILRDWLHYAHHIIARRQ